MPLIQEFHLNFAICSCVGVVHSRDLGAWMPEPRASRGLVVTALTGRSSPLAQPCTGAVPVSLHPGGHGEVLHRLSSRCSSVSHACGRASINCARPRFEVVDTYG